MCTRVEVSPLKIAKRCKICGEFEKKCKMNAMRCELNAMNAVKENFSPQPVECGEEKIFTAKFNANLTKIHRFHSIKR